MASLSFQEMGAVEHMVLQPTPFCNLDCVYCYLPNRSSTKKMSIQTAVLAMQRIFESGKAADVIHIRWHAGEPLTVPIKFYREAIAEIRKISPPDIRIYHSMQTNGTLLNQRWCDFFKEENIQLGVSLDGPAFLHDPVRVTRRGKGTHEKVMQAIDLLKQNEIPFEIIAVIRAESMDYADEIYQFFSTVGARLVGFNIEETEGINQSMTMTQPEIVSKYVRFMQRIYELQKDGDIKIREIEDMKAGLLFAEGERGNVMTHPLSMINVDCDGNISTFSPELLGMNHPTYGTFCFGNVLTDELESLTKQEHFLNVAQDIRAGNENCRNSCEYYFLCGGGAPSNKLYENGSFQSTETFYCVTRIKTVVDIVLADLEAQSN